MKHWYAVGAFVAGFGLAASPPPGMTKNWWIFASGVAICVVSQVAYVVGRIRRTRAEDKITGTVTTTIREDR